MEGGGQTGLVLEVAAKTGIRARLFCPRQFSISSSTGALRMHKGDEQTSYHLNPWFEISVYPRQLQPPVVARLEEWLT